MKNKLQSKPWYANAAAICIGVVLYVVLTRFSALWTALKTFAGYFSPVILGCVIAYLVRPLARLYRRRLFRGIRRTKTQIFLANLLAYITVILFLVLAVLLLIPQLVDSVMTFANNLDSYVASAEAMLERWGVSDSVLDLQGFVDSSENLLKTVTTFVKNNLTRILTTSATAGRSVAQWGIAFLLSMYLLAEKDKLAPGCTRLMRALLKDKTHESAMSFLRRCDLILNRYLVYNLLDSLIVGVVNAIFMVIAGMPYIGLVSFIVAVTNFIPTFGPIVGGAIGAFVLLLVKPWYALAFIGFTLLLQLCDGYVIKPKIFGDSLGVSGLWILIGVIVGGRVFGVIGMLLAIPGVAILDVVYREYLLPWLEGRRKRAGPPPPADGDGTP